jgi:hypothetical protein
LRHDSDLVPRITLQLRLLMECLHRDTTVTYDIQGLKDDGTDVLVRMNTGNGVAFAGIQVKSHDELFEAGLLKTLRDQHSRSVDSYAPLLRWYVLLAADVSGANGQAQGAVRRVQQAFSKKRGVTVIDPVYALTFLRLTAIQMSTLTTLTLRTGDPVVSDSVADLTDRHPLDSAVLIRLVANAVAGDSPTTPTASLLRDEWLTRVATRVPMSPVVYERESDIVDPQPWDAEVRTAYDDWLPYDAWSEGAEGGPPDGVDPERASPALLARWLRADDVSSPSAARLQALLPGSLDRLGDDVEEVGDALYVSIRKHAALYAVATEGIVKHDLDGDSLVAYVVSVLDASAD